MKKLILPILAAICLSAVYAGWDYAPRKAVSKDLVEYLLPAPKKIVDEHGYLERTTVLYNLIVIKGICENQEKRITALETHIKSLKDANGIPAEQPAAPK